MRYTVTENYIEILGRIWMPNAVCGSRMILRNYDVNNIRDREDPGLTRRNVEDWLTCNAGDFSQIIDFHANITQADGADFDSPWQDQDHEYEYMDAMNPAEDED